VISQSTPSNLQQAQITQSASGKTGQRIPGDEFHPPDVALAMACGYFLVMNNGKRMNYRDATSPGPNPQRNVNLKGTRSAQNRCQPPRA